MLIIIGYVVILFCVFGGFAMSGGHLAAVYQPLELLIIGGAAIGALIVGNSGSMLKAIGKAIPKVLKGEKADKKTYFELLALLYAMLNKGRQEGLMSLEADIDDANNSTLFANFPTIKKNHHVMEFICDYFRLIITSNLQPHQLEALMDSEIETHHHEEMQPAHAITKLADGMPAFGIVAAVLGVVHTMESISLPPSELGVLIAHALVGTFLGILLGYGFIGPVANSLELKANNTQLMLNCIKVVILASLENHPPIIASEFGRKVLFSSVRPSFNEMSEQIKSIGNPAAAAAASPAEATS